MLTDEFCINTIPITQETKKIVGNIIFSRRKTCVNTKIIKTCYEQKQKEKFTAFRSELL
jgi:hypothetical protein